VKLTLPQAIALAAAAALVCAGVFTGRLDEYVQKAMALAAGLATVFALFTNAPQPALKAPEAPEAKAPPKEPSDGALGLAIGLVVFGYLTQACGPAGPTPAELGYTAEVHACTLLNTELALACIDRVDCKYNRPECVK
jgi:hypothetical protein